MTAITEADQITEAVVERIEAMVASNEYQAEILSEAVSNAMRALSREDLGWAQAASDTGGLPVSTIKDISKQAVVSSTLDPLIKRGLSIHRTYTWGGGVQITARDKDLNEKVVAPFLDRQSETFTGARARQETFDRLLCTGNLFFALPTNPVTGDVQVREIPLNQVEDIVCNPEDLSDPWYYKRVRSVRKITIDSQSTQVISETVTTWHPASTYRPADRIDTLDGFPVEWDTPVLHYAINRAEGSVWGVSALVSALPWARGYKDFLTDWASLAKSLAKIAYKTTGARGRNQEQVRKAVEGNTEVGGTAILGPGQDLQAVGKSGATIDSGSGRPLAAMVASALDVPVTMLLCDPGVTGARATAETLDRPLQNAINAWREQITTYTRQMLTYVIQQAARATSGPVSGSVRVDPVTRRETVLVTKDLTIDFDWPEVTEQSVAEKVTAITTAASSGVIPDEVVARLLLIALDVENVDEIIQNNTDKDGNWIPADVAPAVNAVRDGNFPTQ